MKEHAPVNTYVANVIRIQFSGDEEYVEIFPANDRFTRFTTEIDHAYNWDVNINLSAQTEALQNMFPDAGVSVGTVTVNEYEYREVVCP